MCTLWWLRKWVTYSRLHCITQPCWSNFTLFHVVVRILLFQVVTRPMIYWAFIICHQALCHFEWYTWLIFHTNSHFEHFFNSKINTDRMCISPIWEILWKFYLTKIHATHYTIGTSFHTESEAAVLCVVICKNYSWGGPNYETHIQ